MTNRKQQGYAIITDPAGPPIESDTFTCYHCNTVVFMKPTPGLGRVKDDGGFCLNCMHQICSPCVAKMNCTPFEKKIEESERRDRERRTRGY